MLSDKEFYLLEYRQCCAKYVATPVEKRRQREFFLKMSKAMAEAYAASLNERKESETW